MKKATGYLSSALLLFLLPLLIALFSTPAANAALDAAIPDGPAIITNKEEVVYARLSSSGEPINAYVVNHFSLARGGSFSDYGNYTSVLNQTDLQPLTLANGSITARTASTNFFYQGYLADQNLPWRYTIEYSLDREILRPENIAGKSGHLDIRVISSPNADINPTFHDNYMQQITLTLNTDTCTNITAEGATAANSGKSRVLTFTVMPEHNANILISADVTDFEMAGINITAMPYAMNVEMPEMDDMLNDFTQLSQALAQLDEGVAKLKTGTAELKSGSEQLKSGSSSFSRGVSQLNSASGHLATASTQIKDALTQLSSSLNETDPTTLDLTDLAALPNGLTQLADGLTQITDTIAPLKEGYSQAYAALDQAITNLPDSQVDPQIYADLYANASPEQQTELTKLINTHTAAQSLKTTYTQTKTTLSSVASALQSISDAITTTSTALTGMSQLIGNALAGSDLTASLQQLADGMSTLSSSYGLFHDGLTTYTEGVSVLAGSYSGINDGVAGLDSGLGTMYGGIADLNNGTGQLADETHSLPAQVQSELDRITNEYAGHTFDAVSFTSEKNNPTIDFVQFVFTADAVEKPTITDNPPPVTEAQSFWERLMNLFK